MFTILAAATKSERHRASVIWEAVETYAGRGRTGVTIPKLESRSTGNRQGELLELLFVGCKKEQTNEILDRLVWSIGDGEKFTTIWMFSRSI